jgi:ferrochelatase
VPIGFVSDHLEILYDIDVECQDFAKANGINLVRTEMLNTSPTFIAALTATVKEHLERDFPGARTKNGIG